MQASTPVAAGSDVRYESLRRNTLIATPLTLLVPVAFAVVLSMLGADLKWSTLGFGALGWFGALLLRAPLAAVLTQVLGDPERVKPWIISSSGPFEEIVRVLLLVLVGRSFSDAAAVGIGWAAIEVLYTTLTGFITLSLVRRTDPEAMQARQILEAQGMIKETGPWLGIIERIAATALHIGFTFIVAWSLITAIATAIVHSATNLTMVRMFKERPMMTELLLFAFGLAMFVLGIVLVR
jgi:hypothetical protein